MSVFTRKHPFLSTSGISGTEILLLPSCVPESVARTLKKPGVRRCSDCKRAFAGGSDSSVLACGYKLPCHTNYKCIEELLQLFINIFIKHQRDLRNEQQEVLFLDIIILGVNVMVKLITELNLPDNNAYPSLHEAVSVKLKGFYTMLEHVLAKFGFDYDKISTLHWFGVFCRAFHEVKNALNIPIVAALIPRSLCTCGIEAQVQPWSQNIKLKKWIDHKASSNDGDSLATDEVGICSVCKTPTFLNVGSTCSDLLASRRLSDKFLYNMDHIGLEIPFLCSENCSAFKPAKNRFNEKNLKENLFDSHGYCLNCGAEATLTEPCAALCGLGYYCNNECRAMAEGERGHVCSGCPMSEKLNWDTIFISKKGPRSIDSIPLQSGGVLEAIMLQCQGSICRAVACQKLLSRASTSGDLRELLAAVQQIVRIQVIENNESLYLATALWMSLHEQRQAIFQKAENHLSSTTEEKDTPKPEDIFKIVKDIITELQSYFLAMKARIKDEVWFVMLDCFTLCIRMTVILSVDFKTRAKSSCLAELFSSSAPSLWSGLCQLTKYTARPRIMYQFESDRFMEFPLYSNVFACICMLLSEVQDKDRMDYFLGRKEKQKKNKGRRHLLRLVHNAVVGFKECVSLQDLDLRFSALVLTSCIWTDGSQWPERLCRKIRKEYLRSIETSVLKLYHQTPPRFKKVCYLHYALSVIGAEVTAMVKISESDPVLLYYQHNVMAELEDNRLGPRSSCTLLQNVLLFIKILLQKQERMGISVVPLLLELNVLGPFQCLLAGGINKKEDTEYLLYDFLNPKIFQSGTLFELISHIYRCCYGLREPDGLPDCYTIHEGPDEKQVIHVGANLISKPSLMINEGFRSILECMWEHDFNAATRAELADHTFPFVGNRVDLGFYIKHIWKSIQNIERVE